MSKTTNGNSKKLVKWNKPMVPDGSQSGSVKGLEGITQEMIIVPRIKIIQAMSAEVNELDIPSGTMINSLTKEILAKKNQTLTVVPLGMVNINRVLFAPIGEGNSFLCRSLDGKNGEGDPGGECSKCEKNEWTKDRKGQRVAPLCTEFRNVVVWPLLPDAYQPIIASFGRTSIGEGTKFINMMWQKRMNPWYFTYEFQTKQISNDKGTFFIFKITPSGKAPEDLISAMDAYYDWYSNIDFEVHQEVEETPQKNSNDFEEAVKETEKKENPPF